MQNHDGLVYFLLLISLILVYFAKKGRKENDRCILFLSFLFCLFFSCVSVTVFDLRLELQIFLTMWFMIWSYVDLLLILDSSLRRVSDCLFDNYWG